MLRYFLPVLLGLFVLIVGVSVTPARAQDSCYADLDVNGDGLPLSVADYILMVRYFAGDTTIDVAPYHLDINGDGMVDDGDLELFSCYFVYGMSCFNGDYPVLTTCDPVVVTGACCLPGDSCSIRTQANCDAMGGTYKGDGTHCVPLPCTCCELRGDVDGSHSINVGDLTFLVAYVFKDGPAPACLSAADANGDGTINVADIATAEVPLIFGGGPALPPCGAVVYPQNASYQFAIYDQNNALLSVDTLALTFYGADSANLIMGQFIGGTPSDSVTGGGTMTAGMSLHNLHTMQDAGFDARVTVQGDVAAGTIQMVTFTGTYDRLLIMREL